MNSSALTAVLPGWKVMAASVQGSAHRKCEQPCQDRCCWETVAGKTLVAAVADGAGTASLGGLGATIASSTAVELACRRLGAVDSRLGDIEWRHLLKGAARVARNALVAEARNRQVSAMDLATTLILAVATPAVLAVAQIGDGAVVVGYQRTGLAAVTLPQHGEFLNETFFLVSPGALERIDLKVWRGPVSHVALLSDGLQMLALKMPGGTPHAPFFLPMWEIAARSCDAGQGHASLVEFLESPRIAARTDDDLTLLLGSLEG